jgi:hypothetical protein
MLFQTDFELIYWLLADNYKWPVYAQQCHLGTCQQTRPGMCILICALLLPSKWPIMYVGKDEVKTKSCELVVILFTEYY